MKLSRRGILKILPAVPFAAKRAATAVAEAIDPATGIKVLGGEGRSGLFSRTVDPGDMYGSDSDEERFEEQTRIRDLLKWISNKGVPAWKKREIRKRAMHTRTLDPDIAGLRSVSLHYKLRMQWAREEKRLLDKELDWMNRYGERESWLKNAGIKYW